MPDDKEHRKAGIRVEKAIKIKNAVKLPIMVEMLKSGLLTIGNCGDQNKMNEILHFLKVGDWNGIEYFSSHHERFKKTSITQ